MTNAKTIILALTACALAQAGANRVQAGQGEWATAGKVLTGVAAGAVLVKVLNSVCHTTPCSTATTVVYTQPAPTVVYTQPPPPPQVVYQQPVVAQPQVVYQPPVVYQQPVIVQHPVLYQQPVVVQPAPVYVQTAPVYMAPAPVIAFYGPGWRYSHYPHYSQYRHFRH